MKSVVDEDVCKMYHKLTPRSDVFLSKLHTAVDDGRSRKHWTNSHFIYFHQVGHVTTVIVTEIKYLKIVGENLHLFIFSYTITENDHL